jgi:hypothetical protein
VEKNFQETLDSHNKALMIEEELNDRDGMGRDYANISSVLVKISNGI